MATHNDITGDLIKSRSNSEDYRDNYDRIFNRTYPTVSSDASNASPKRTIEAPIKNK